MGVKPVDPARAKIGFGTNGTKTAGEECEDGKLELIQQAAAGSHYERMPVKRTNPGG